MNSINSMTPAECKAAYPKAKWLQPAKSPTMRPECPEAALQTYANDAITLRRWAYIRFDSRLMWWLKANAPGWIQGLFFSQVAGKLPDNVILVPLSPGKFLAVKLELKTQDKKGRSVGRLHGKQRHYAEVEGWYIARSPEQIDAVLDEVQAEAEKIKSTCGGNNVY
jgi:hypothetical protein